MKQSFLNWSLIAFGLMGLAGSVVGFALHGTLSVDLVGVLLIVVTWNMQTRTTPKAALGLQSLHVLGSVSVLALGILEVAGLPSFLNVPQGPEACGMAIPFLGWGIANALGLIRELRQDQPVRAAA